MQNCKYHRVSMLSRVACTRSQGQTDATTWERPNLPTLISRYLYIFQMGAIRSKEWFPPNRFQLIGRWLRCFLIRTPPLMRRRRRLKDSGLVSRASLAADTVVSVLGDFGAGPNVLMTNPHSPSILDLSRDRFALMNGVKERPSKPCVFDWSLIILAYLAPTKKPLWW